MNAESGIRPQRLEYVEEPPAPDGIQEPPENPNYENYSDNPTATSWSPDVGTTRRDGLGTPDPVTFHSSPESHEFTVEYDLQKALVNAAGDPVDAAAYGVLRDEINAFLATHTLVMQERNRAPASETFAESVARNTRLTLVGKGGRIEEVTLSGDPGSDAPVTVELSYTFEKVREYQFDQPTGDTAFALESTDDADTFTVEISHDDGTVEEIALNGTTEVVTTATADNIDGIALLGEPQGNVTVSEGSGGDTLTRIRGRGEYDGIEGDLGTPAIGTGSHAAPNNKPYETILNDTVTRDGAALAYEYNSVEFVVSNDLATRERVGTLRMGISVGSRTTEITATVGGSTESMQTYEEALTNASATIEWTLDNTLIRGIDARLTDPGDVSKDAENARLTLDNTFEAEKPEVVAP